MVQQHIKCICQHAVLIISEFQSTKQIFSHNHYGAVIIQNGLFVELNQACTFELFGWILLFNSAITCITRKIALSKRNKMLSATNRKNIKLELCHGNGFHCITMTNFAKLKQHITQ